MKTERKGECYANSRRAAMFDRSTNDRRRVKERTGVYFIRYGKTTATPVVISDNRMADGCIVIQACDQQVAQSHHSDVIHSDSMQ